MKQNYEYHEDFLLKNEIEYLKSKLNHIQWQKNDTTKLIWVSGGFETTMNPHPEWVIPLLEYMKSSFKTEFNYILYSKYNSLNHSSGPNQNNKFWLGENPTTPLLGVGNSIQLELINKHTSVKESLNFKNNDLLLIDPRHQDDWLVAIPNGNFLIEPHYSLSFRKVIHSDGDKNYYQP